jgi:cold shock CspA family protein
MKGRCRGMLRHFNFAQEIGFIAPEAGGDDVFFHRDHIDGVGYVVLSPGEPVEYEMDTHRDRRGEAIRVWFQPVVCP